MFILTIQFHPKWAVFLDPTRKMHNIGSEQNEPKFALRNAHDDIRYCMGH